MLDIGTDFKHSLEITRLIIIGQRVRIPLKATKYKTHNFDNSSGMRRGNCSIKQLRLNMSVHCKLERNFTSKAHYLTD